MKRLLQIVMVLSMATSAIAMEPRNITTEDIQAAIEAKYGPFKDETINVQIESRGPYSGQTPTNHDGSLPDGIQVAVWDKNREVFAVLTDDGTRIAGTASIEVLTGFATRRLSVGEVIAPSDIELRSVKVKTLSQGSRSQLSELVGKEVIKTIAPNRPIPHDAINSPKAVSRNEEVTIIFTKGSLQLTAKGKSLSNAAVGEIVKIVRPDATRPLEGVAVAKGVVKIIETGVVK